MRAWLEKTDATVQAKEPVAEEPLPNDLVEAITGADTLAKLDAVVKKVTTELVSGNMDRSLGAVVIEALKEQRQVLRLKRQEEAQVALTAIELLTPGEAEVLREYRAKLAGPPLLPGESVPPPTLPAPAPVPAPAEVKS